MAADNPDLLSLARAVADGAEVDWASAETGSSDPAHRRALGQLRQLDHLARAARAQAAAWGPLEIRETVGSGTFGTVYRAWDPRLEREVALKLLHPGGPPVDQSALIREGRLLARIRHPNVVTVYGADAFGGRVGIWMEFLSGRTLKAIVDAQGPYGAAEAALIGRDVCRALAAIHGVGLLHRDVKAQNVMREAGGRTVLMDLGAGEPARGETAAHSPLRGTPLYLAPEVIDGAQPSVRSDLYAAGVLLFFLVSGQFPVSGASLDEIRAAHAKIRRNRLRDLRPEIPAGFVRAIECATALDPGERPDSAGALEAMLDDGRVLREQEGGVPVSKRSRARPAFYAGLAAAVVAAAAILWLALQSLRPAPSNAVAVLPFVNVSNDAETASFSAGIADKVAARLTGSGRLHVIAGAPVAAYARGDRTRGEIGVALGAASALSGSVIRSDREFHVDVQLVDAQTGEVLWTDTFERAAGNAGAQLDISRDVSAAVTSVLSLAESESLGRTRPRDWQTFALYQSGRYYARKRREAALRTSLQYYQKVIDRQPDYAPPYAGMADSYALMGVASMMDQEDAMSRALTAATKANSLDPDLAEAYASLGYIHKQRFEWSLAESNLRSAIDRKATYAQAHHWYSIYLSQHGRFPEAVNEAKTALALDPEAISTNAQLGTVLSLYRRYDESIAQFESVLARDPSYLSGYEIIGENYVFKGDHGAALASFDQARRVAPLGLENHGMLADRALALALSGRRVEAAAVLSELLDRQRRNPRGIAANIASVYAALGDRASAFDWLEQAMARRDQEIGYLKVDPRWDPLRGDPRFDALLVRMGFARSPSAP